MKEVEVDILGTPVPNSAFGFDGRKTTVNSKHSQLLFQAARIALPPFPKVHVLRPGTG